MTATSIRKLSTLAFAAALLLPAGGATLLSGCGDDGQSQQQQQKPAQRRKRGRHGRKRGRHGKKGKGGKLQTYPKIAKEYRHDLDEKDFKPDSTGEKNRDPFYSYVIRQPGAPLEKKEGLGIEPTDVCDEDNTRATSYSLRDLTLIGIVLRGTRAWAQFRDSAGVGHIVRRGYCLGKEKAIVKQIGAGYVRLEVTPEVSPTEKTPEPKTQDIPLYPQELELEDLKSSEE